MGENRQLALVIIGVAVLSSIALAISHFNLSNTDVRAEYTAVIHPNGTIIEFFKYIILADKKYSMLYRFWEAPLSISYLDEPHIEFLGLECPSESLGYLKDYEGKTLIFSPSGDRIISSSMSAGSPEYIYWLDISTRAFFNEVGCYFPALIQRGEYTATFKFLLRPQIQCDDSYCHVNIMLAREHIVYSKVNITLIDPNGDIEGIYVHTPDYAISKRGETIQITGQSPTNTLLEVEFYYKRNGNFLMPGFTENSSNIIEKTIENNNWYSFSYSLVKYTSVVLLAIIISYPLIVLGLYYLWGREKKFVVPKYLSYVPDPNKKPWLVNLLFKGDAMKIDSDALYATILDLERKGLLDIEGNEDRVIIHIKDNPKTDLDPYERSVYEFLSKYSNNSVFDIVEFHDFVKKVPQATAVKVYRDMKSLLSTSKWMVEIAKRFVESKRWAFALLTGISALATVIAFLTAESYGWMYGPCISMLPFYTLILTAQNIIPLAAPAQLFGRWKGDGYREKLEWEAFKNMLEDLAMIQKYAPQDLIVWKEWLIYGTALGVGKKVAEAMKKLNIPPPPSAHLVYVWPKYYHAAISTAVSKASGGAGGGGGVGRGFGGGGGGVR